MEQVIWYFEYSNQRVQETLNKDEPVLVSVSRPASPVVLEVLLR